MNEKLRVALIAYLEALNISLSDEEWDVSSKVTEIRDKDVAAPIGGVDVSDGASKICLVFKNFPFVIKWDNDGYGEAAREVSIYNDAVACNLAYFFPKTELFHTYNGISFVLQEKIDCDAGDARWNDDYKKVIKRVTKTPTDRIYEKMQREFNKARRSYRRTLDESWAKMVISLYGKKATKALCEFIVKHGINDLHQGNIGYKNYRPIILDFSGYYR